MAEEQVTRQQVRAANKAADRSGRRLNKTRKVLQEKLDRLIEAAARLFSEEDMEFLGMHPKADNPHTEALVLRIVVHAISREWSLYRFGMNSHERLMPDCLGYALAAWSAARTMYGQNMRYHRKQLAVANKVSSQYEVQRREACSKAIVSSYTDLSGLTRGELAKNLHHYRQCQSLVANRFEKELQRRNNESRDRWNAAHNEGE